MLTPLLRPEEVITWDPSRRGKSCGRWVSTWHSPPSIPRWAGASWKAFGEAQGALGLPTTSHGQTQSWACWGTTLLMSALPGPAAPSWPAGSWGFTLGLPEFQGCFFCLDYLWLTYSSHPSWNVTSTGSRSRFLRLVSILYCILLKQPHNSLYYDELHICATGC